MSDVTKCPSCGSLNESGAHFCAQCGNNMQDNDSPSPRAMPGKYVGMPREGDRRALDHLKVGIGVALEQPMVFLPSIISGVLGVMVSITLSNVGVNYWASLLIGSTSSIFSFILNFAATDMSRDAYYKQRLDLGQSIQYVIGRLFTFILAAIFGGLLSITIVLIPVVLFMFVIMVMDETGILEAFERAFNVIRSELSDVIILLIVSIIASAVIGYVPFFSTLLNSFVNVIMGIAFIDIYLSHKQRQQDNL